jgi:hypothetical protein
MNRKRAYLGFISTAAVIGVGAWLVYKNISFIPKPQLSSATVTLPPALSTFRKDFKELSFGPPTSSSGSCALDENNHFRCWENLLLRSQIDRYFTFQLPSPLDIQDWSIAFLRKFGDQLKLARLCVRNKQGVGSCFLLDFHYSSSKRPYSVNIQQDEIQFTALIKRFARADRKTICALTLSQEIVCLKESSANTWQEVLIHRSEIPLRSLQFENAYKDDNDPKISLYGISESNGNVVTWVPHWQRRYCKKPGVSKSEREAPCRIPNLQHVEDLQLSGLGYGCALTTEHEVYCFGDFSMVEKEPGKLSLSAWEIPRKVEALDSIQQIVVASTDYCALDTASKLYCWGTCRNDDLNSVAKLVWPKPMFVFEKSANHRKLPARYPICLTPRQVTHQPSILRLMVTEDIDRKMGAFALVGLSQSGNQNYLVPPSHLPPTWINIR